MKKILIFLLFISGFLQIAMPQKFTIKFATLAPEGSTWLKVMEEYNDEVKQLTDGNVKFKIYPGGIQGDEKDVLSKIILGQLHSAGFTGLGMGEIISEVRILDSPFLFRNNEEVDYISNILYDEFSQKFEEAGYILLGWTEAGFVYVFGNKPIYSQQDLKGPKVWLWEGDILAEAYFRALGVSPIPMSITDVLTALQTNMIELVYSPPLACVTMQWYTKVKYMMDVPLADVAGAVLISKKMYDKMPESYQEILRQQGRKHMRRLVELSRQDNEESIELMRKNGIEIVSVPPENLGEFYAAGQQARRSLVGKLYPKELLDRVENLLTEYRKNKQ